MLVTDATKSEGVCEAAAKLDPLPFGRYRWQNRCLAEQPLSTLRLSRRLRWVNSRRKWFIGRRTQKRKSRRDWAADRRKIVRHDSAVCDATPCARPDWAPGLGSGIWNGAAWRSLREVGRRHGYRRGRAGIRAGHQPCRHF